MPLSSTVSSTCPHLRSVLRVPRVTRFITADDLVRLANELSCENRYLDRDRFVNAIAPSETRIGRAQFAILFRVADTSKRGLVSWDDFTVFQTLLKRPDADYYMAFEYFDV